MTDQLPTVSIKGNAYVLVKDRIAYFNEKYPQGDIHTDLVSNENGQVVMKAVVTPDTEKPNRFFTGFSQARENDGMVNKTAALENAESSAVGRALAMMGIGVIESIASADEVAKAISQQPTAVQPSTQAILAKAASKRSQPITDSTQYTCEKCGEPADLKVGTSKAGNPYRGIFCSVDRDHVTWLKPGEPVPTPRIVTEAKQQPDGLTEDDDRLAHGDGPSNEPTAEEINKDIPF